VKTTPFCIDGHLICDGPIDITVRSRPGVVYHNQDFSHLALTNASLTNTTFVNCNMTECNLRWTRATSVAFINCNLSGIDATGSGFTKVRFTNSVLNNAQFSTTKFYDCDLGENIARAQICGARVTLGTALPAGLTPLVFVDRRGNTTEPELLEVNYDVGYLTRFARTNAVDLLINEHADAPLTTIVALLQALAPVYA
jgi:hypothetical protein